MASNHSSAIDTAFMNTPAKATEIPKDNKPLDSQQIYDFIFKAIADRQLPPGKKLSEERLSKIFNVSRTRLREVFFRLAQDKIITLEPNRGAFVVKPTVKETREVFAARRAIEVAIIEELTNKGNSTVFKALANHLMKEETARKAGDRQKLNQLTGEFHLLLAELTNNSLFYDITRRLIALSSVIISLYDSPTANECEDFEHEAIVNAIKTNNAQLAKELLLNHLNHVEHSLEIDDNSTSSFDVEAVFENMIKAQL